MDLSAERSVVTVPDGTRTVTPAWRGAAVLPVAAAGLLIGAANLVLLYFRLRLPYPVNAWEAAAVTDAWRMLQGDAIYAATAHHATWCFGPLVTVFLAQVFRFTGPVLQAGRVLSVACGLGMVVLIARALVARGDRLAFWAAAALLLAANSRTLNYFAETRPDADAFFFATVALIFLYRGLETGGECPRFALAAIGCVFLAVAILFKQTAIMVMGIPALATLGRFGFSCPRNRALAATMPILTVLAVAGAVWHFSPGMWGISVAAPAQFSISAARVIQGACALYIALPLLLLALAHWLSTDAIGSWRSPQARWLVAAIVCAIPASALEFGRDGGDVNSFLPTLVSAGAFCAWRSPAALAFLRDSSRPLGFRIPLGALLAGAMLLQATPPSRGFSLLMSPNLGYGARDRALVISEARLLPGKVVSPDDPTIALWAKGYSGRAVVSEADAVHWDLSRGQALKHEVESADYVVMMQPVTAEGEALVSISAGCGWVITSDFLRAKGFEKIPFKTTSTPVYTLWRRSRPFA